MALKINWTTRAHLNFEKTINHLKLSFGERATKAFVQKTFVIIEILSEYPQIGSIEILEKEVRGISLTKHNKLFYRFDERDLILLNVFDTRQNPKKNKL